MSKFNINDEVRWTSQAAGSKTSKRGKVVHVTPAGRRPVMDTYTHKAISAYGGGRHRDHESYVVLVPGKTPRSKPTLYWPVVSLLVLVEAANG